MIQSTLDAMSARGDAHWMLDEIQFMQGHVDAVTHYLRDEKQ